MSDDRGEHTSEGRARRAAEDRGATDGIKETPDTSPEPETYPVLAAPAGGIPDVIDDERALQLAADAIAAADEARVSRGQSAGATMPGMVWFGLISGGLVTVGLIFTLQIRRSARELLLAGLFSALIAFLLFLIWDLDAPFGSGLTVSSDALRAIL